MSDDLIERFSDYVEVALDPSGAAQALTAAQARIAELEAERDAAHERGRLQGLDEAAEKAMDASHFVDDETGVRWCDQHEAVALIEALKAKGGE